MAEVQLWISSFSHWLWSKRRLINCLRRIITRMKTWSNMNVISCMRTRTIELKLSAEPELNKNEYCSIPNWTRTRTKIISMQNLNFTDHYHKRVHENQSTDLVHNSTLQCYAETCMLIIHNVHITVQMLASTRSPFRRINMDSWRLIDAMLHGRSRIMEVNEWHQRFYGFVAAVSTTHTVQCCLTTWLSTTNIVLQGRNNNGEDATPMSIIKRLPCSQPMIYMPLVQP